MEADHPSLQAGVGAVDVLNVVDPFDHPGPLADVHGLILEQTFPVMIADATDVTLERQPMRVALDRPRASGAAFV